MREVEGADVGLEVGGKEGWREFKESLRAGGVGRAGNGKGKWAKG